MPGASTTAGVKINILRRVSRMEVLHEVPQEKSTRSLRHMQPLENAHPAYQRTLIRKTFSESKQVVLS